MKLLSIKLPAILSIQFSTIKSFNFSRNHSDFSHTKPKTCSKTTLVDKQTDNADSQRSDDKLHELMLSKLQHHKHWIQFHKNVYLSRLPHCHPPSIAQKMFELVLSFLIMEIEKQFLWSFELRGEFVLEILIGFSRTAGRGETSKKPQRNSKPRTKQEINHLMKNFAGPVLHPSATALKGWGLKVGST